MSPGLTEVKQDKFVEFKSRTKGYFRETFKSQNINPISKIMVLEWSQQISHCKSSMQIFYDAQGKLTPQSEVGSTLNSNSSKPLVLSL